MPSNLTDADSFDTVAAPIGTDTRNASSVRTPLQALTNRARYLYNRLNPLADFAALKAVDVTGMATGTYRFVIGQGAYTYDSSSVLAEALPFVVQPTVGSGRWISGTAHRTTRTLRIYCGPNFSWMTKTLAVAGGSGTDASLFVTNVAPLNAAKYSEIDAVPVYLSGGGIQMAGLPASTNRYVLFVNLPLPDGCTITQIQAAINPGNVGGLPANMPWLSAIRLSNTSGDFVDTNNGGAFLLSTEKVVDSSGTVGAFNAAHTITLTPNQNNVTDSSLYTFQAALGATSGASAAVGDVWKYIDVTLTMTDARGW